MSAPSWSPAPARATRARLVRRAVVACLLLTIVACAPIVAQDTPPADRWQPVRELCESAIAEKKFPGCVVVIGNSQGVQFQQAFGHRRLLPAPEPMTLDTVFDLASLTKPIATATSILKLIDQGQVEVDAPVMKYLPEFGVNGKEAITIRQLLTHQGGLIADNHIDDYSGTRAENLARVMALRTTVPPGSKFIYSDVGFIVLGEVVARVSQQPLELFAREQIFVPLGMHETAYVPSAELQARCATTQQRDGRWLRGEVHDPRAIRLDGVAGHAGLFSTGADVARYAQAMLSAQSAQPVFHPATWELMTTTNEVPTQKAEQPVARRGLGWDLRSPFSRNRPMSMSDKAFGHSGFTGTSLWIDPGSDLFVVFLSNRVHPDGKGLSNPTAAYVGDAAKAALSP